MWVDSNFTMKQGQEDDYFNHIIKLSYMLELNHNTTNEY